MSTAEEQTRGNAGAGQPSGDGAGGMIILFFIVGLVASLLLGWVIFPKLLYSQKEQPVDFNHALHVQEVDDGCQSCHYFHEDGTFSGIPKLDNCLECHEEMMGESEEEARFYEQYVVPGREVPWLVRSQQPDCVFFSHVAHVVTAKMDCVSCHGHIGESEHSRPYYQNRISRYSRDIWGHNIAGIARNSWDRMKMDTCAACHRREGVRQDSVQTEKGGCFVCHK
jgi:hypothetical protein